MTGSHRSRESNGSHGSLSSSTRCMARELELRSAMEERPVQRMNSWAQRKFGRPGDQVCLWNFHPGSGRVSIEIAWECRNKIQQNVPTFRNHIFHRSQGEDHQQKKAELMQAKDEIASRFLASLTGTDRALLEEPSWRKRRRAEYFSDRMPKYQKF